MKKILFLVVFMIAQYSNAQAGIGTTNPNLDAVLELYSTDKGLLLPRVALTGIANAAPLAAHVQGMTIYNIATVGDVTPGFYYNDGTKWMRIANPSPWINNPGSSLIELEKQSNATTLRPSGTEFVALDNGSVGIGTSAPDASAKLELTSTTQGFLPPRMSTAQRNAIVAPTEGLLIYNTDDECFDTYRSDGVWVSMCCVFIPNSNSYGVTAKDGRCWMDRNLGATQVATAFNDYLAYGSSYQWGRGSDGHEVITWTSSTQGTGLYGYKSTKATNYIPEHNKFINRNYDWLDPPNDNLWQGVNGINNPCPSGYRLPTIEEWTAVVTAEGITNRDTAFNSTLKLTTAGDRNVNSANLTSAGNKGYYNSSSIATNSGKNNYFFYFTSSSTTYNQGANRSAGFSVRCIKE